MSGIAKIGRSVITAGLAVTLWTSAILFGSILVLTALTWVFSADLDSSLSDVISFATAAFLVMHGIEVSFAELILDLRFTGFIFFIFFLLYRTFRWSLKSSLESNPNNPTARALLVLLVGVISYSGLIFALYFTQTKNIDNWLTVLAWPISLSFSAGLMAVLSVGGTWSLVKAGFDETSQKIINNVRRSFTILLTISFLLLIWLGYLSRQEILGVFFDLGADAFAVVIIILLGLGWLPNYLIWTWAIVSDVILNLGTSTISLSSVVITQLPAWPWFALLPEQIPGWGNYLVALPILIGVLIAIFAHHQKYPNWLVGVFFSILILSSLNAILLWFSNGSLGVGQLQTFGADPILLFQNSLKFFLIGAAIVVSLKVLWQRATAPQETPEVSETK